MKKVILLLGVITLTACGNDFETFEGLEHNDIEDSGSDYQPLTVSGGYTSPWDYLIEFL